MLLACWLACLLRASLVHVLSLAWVWPCSCAFLGSQFVVSCSRTLDVWGVRLVALACAQVRAMASNLLEAEYHDVHVKRPL